MVTSAEDLLTKEERKRVAQAIAQAEQATSSEIRVHLEDHIEEDVLDHAAYIFQELGMHRTAERNGILIYICVADRQMAVIGDKGINEKVPEGFWDGVIGTLRRNFQGGDFAAGLIEVVEMVGELASTHFPRRGNDRNELSNEVSFSRK